MLLFTSQVPRFDMSLWEDFMEMHLYVPSRYEGLLQRGVVRV